MKFAVKLLIHGFIFVFALSVTAQHSTPKISWKNVSEKYDSFYDIKPVVVNETGRTIYFDIYFFPNAIVLERLVGTDEWQESMPWRCGTGYKPSVGKLISFAEARPYFDKAYWDESTIDDGISPKFTKYPDYQGKGKYRLRFRFGLKKRNYDQFVSYSPQFEVIEKDFRN